MTPLERKEELIRRYKEQKNNAQPPQLIGALGIKINPDAVKWWQAMCGGEPS